jgi:peptide/nickel transport system substrate-binding protein
MIYLYLDDPGLAFFQEVDVRRALIMGLNRQWIVDRLIGGQAIIANGPIFPDSWAYYEGIEKVGYDPEAAIALLKQIGYTIPSEGGSVRTKDGVQLSFEMVYPEGEYYTIIAESIQKDWSQLGVQVDLKPVPYDELVNDYLESRAYQTALAEIDLARSPDPDPYPFWHQTQVSGGQNYSGWDDRQASEYLEQARVQVDYDERARLYRNFQVRFVDEMPAIPLFYPVYSYGIAAEVRGVSMGPLFDPSDRFLTISSWFLVTRRSTQAPDLQETALP